LLLEIYMSQFTDGLAAQYAMNMMHGAEINGTIIKLTIANVNAAPQVSLPDISRKRQKT
jgi:hypothetical protein